MRFSIANLLLLGAAVAAPIVELDRSKEIHHGDFISRGLVPVLPRAFVPPVRVPVKPPLRPIGHPVDPPPAVLPEPINPVGPVRAPGSPGTPPKNSNEPAEPPVLTVDAPPKTPAKDQPGEPPILTGAPPPKIPAKDQPGFSCNLKRGACRPGADPKLNIDGNYDRLVEAKGPNADFLTKAGIDTSGPEWRSATIDKGPDARRQFDEKILPEYEAKYNPANNPDSEFEGWEYEFLKQSEQGSFGSNGGRVPFIETINNHGKQPGIVIGQMFKQRDIYNGCKNCVFEMGTVPKLYERPAIPRPEGVPEVVPSQSITDNWRVTSKQLGAKSDDITFFAMKNIATGESKTILKNVFKAEEGDKTYQAGTPEFAEIEKTVQSGIIRRQLETEKATFGDKKVTAHRIFFDGHELNC